jgi:hypothetical protein
VDLLGGEDLDVATAPIRVALNLGSRLNGSPHTFFARVKIPWRTLRILFRVRGVIRVPR